MAQLLNGTNDGVVTSVIQTIGDGYVFGGYSNFDPGVTSDFWLFKTDSLGNLQWDRTFYESNNYDMAQSVIATSDGGYALFGTSTPDAGGEGSFWLVKTDSEGQMEWNQLYGGPDKNLGYSIVETNDGGFVMGGGIWLRTGGGGFNAALIKTDSSGMVLWNQTYEDGVTRCVVQTSDRGYALAGSFGLIKTDDSGNLQWNQSLGVDAYSLVQTNDGGYAVVGGDVKNTWLFEIIDQNADGTPLATSTATLSSSPTNNPATP